MPTCNKKVIDRYGLSTITYRVCDDLAELIHHLESIRYILKVFLKWKNNFGRTVISRAHALSLEEDAERLFSNYIVGLGWSSRFFDCCRNSPSFLKNFASYFTSIGLIYSKFNISSPVKYYYWFVFIIYIVHNKLRGF